MKKQSGNIETINNSPFMQVDMDLLSEKFTYIEEVLWNKMVSNDTYLLETFSFRIHLNDVIIGYKPTVCPDLGGSDYVALGQLLDMFLDAECKQNGLVYEPDHYNFSKYVVTELTAPCTDNKKIYSLYKEYHLVNVELVDDDSDEE